MKSVLIMAGGKGQRLRPLTETIPKPLIKVKDVPLLSYVIGYLNKAGIQNEEMLICLSYMSECFKEYLSRMGIGYFISNAGLAQNIYICSKWMCNPFMVVSADIIQSKRIIKESLDAYRETGASALFHCHSDKRKIVEFYVDETIRPRSTLSIFNSRDITHVKDFIKPSYKFTDLAMLLSNHGFKVYYLMTSYPYYEIDTPEELEAAKGLDLTQFYE